MVVFRLLVAAVFADVTLESPPTAVFIDFIADAKELVAAPPPLLWPVATRPRF